MTAVIDLTGQRFEGKTLTVAEWTENLGFTYQTIYQRLNRGWSITRALTTPLVAGHIRSRTPKNKVYAL